MATSRVQSAFPITLTTAWLLFS